MNLITSTEIRTKMPQVLQMLQKGEAISIVHRSRIVGKITPERETLPKKISAKRLEEKINKLGFPRLPLKEIDRRYRAAMIKKHGKGLS